MATDQDRKTIERRASSSFVRPVFEMPKIPDELKKRPEYKAAWEAFERMQDEWRKTLMGIQAGARITSATTVTGAGAGGAGAAVSQSGPVSGGDVAHPVSEVDLKSLYLMTWLWA